MMETSQARRHAFTELRQSTNRNWSFCSCAVTDVGRRRQVNEDYYLLHPQRNLFLVADGMGGHAAGEVAAEMSCQTVAAYFDEVDIPSTPVLRLDDRPSLQEYMVQAVKLANASVYQEAAEHPERQGMGNTIVVLTFQGERAYFAHVGDSRLYRLRGDRLTALTRDHSLLEKTIDRLQLSPEEALRFRANFRHKNILSRALGSRYGVTVDVASAELQEGDLFLMTTDGAHDHLEHEALRQLLIDHQPRWTLASQALIDAANQAGGPDNITALFVEAKRRR